ncbi:MAG: hypothetical protein IPM21_04270 [Acidobacteria bacterium]|nr:hypothetical protein [Acidobacteriota bacterium]
MKYPIESTNPVVRTLIEGAAPQPARLAAARGVLPLPQADLLEALAHLASDADAAIATAARETLAGQEAAAVSAVLQSENAPRAVLDHFAAHPGVAPEIHEIVFRNPKTSPEAIVSLAENSTSTAILDSIATNQQILIRHPKLIDAVLANPNRSPDAERHVAETRREFFEKERGAEQIANELRAQGKDAAAEFFESAESDLDFEDAMLIAAMIEVPDADTDDSWMGLEYIEELYEETDEQRQHALHKIIGEFKGEEGDISYERVSMINRVMMMGMKDRVKLAMKGDREARNILIRDPNRIVAQAVINNARITEQEVEKIAAMRAVPEDVLRTIANGRQWARNYAVIHNLARNPRTPIASVLPILTRLQARDLVGISKNKNVSDAVRRQALRLSQMRKGG